MTDICDKPGHLSNMVMSVASPSLAEIDLDNLQAIIDNIIFHGPEKQLLIDAKAEIVRLRAVAGAVKLTTWPTFSDIAKGLKIGSSL